MSDERRVNRLTRERLKEIRDRSDRVQDVWWHFEGDHADDLYQLIDDIPLLLDALEENDEQ